MKQVAESFYLFAADAKQYFQKKKKSDFCYYYYYYYVPLKKPQTSVTLHTSHNANKSNFGF